MIIKPDLLCVLPNHIIYPLFNKFIHQNGDKFHKIILVITDMNTHLPNYQQFLVDQLRDDKITIIRSNPIEAHVDWRQQAIKQALTVSTGAWIYFCEPDFTPLNGFWKEVYGLAERVDAFGYFQDQRLHPCCIFIKRELLNKTSQDFSAYPETYGDHFGKFQHELEKRISLGVIHHWLGEHMNGLSQNIYMLQTGEIPNYNPPRFKKYCEACLASEFKMPQAMIELFKDYVKNTD